MINKQCFNKVSFPILFLFIIILTTVSLCSCSASKSNINPVTLDDFKETAVRHGLESKLDPVMSEDNKLIGYSIKTGSDSKSSNLMFYDVKKEENIEKLYSTCVNSVKHTSSLEHVTADVSEESEGNYEYVKATNFKTDDKYSMELPLQIAYTIRVDCTCLYMNAYPTEYDEYVSIANELGYMM